MTTDEELKSNRGFSEIKTTDLLKGIHVNEIHEHCEEENCS